MEKNEKPIYECPVCLEKLYSPIYQCYNGHLICSQCINKVALCPVCREKMSQKRIRNLEVEKITGKAPFICPNTKSGCLDLEEHLPMDCEFLMEKFCSRLEIQNCHENIYKRDFVTHLIEDHGINGEIVTAGDIIDIEQSYTNWQDLEKGTLRWKPVYICQGRETFFLHTSFKNGEISWNVTLLGSDTSADRFDVKIKLPCGDELKRSFLQWEGPVASLLSKGSKDYFMVSKQVLKSYRKGGNQQDDQDGSWKLQILISKSSRKEGKSVEVAAKIRNEAYTEEVKVLSAPSSFANMFRLRQQLGPNVFTIFVQTQPGFQCGACGVCPDEKMHYLCNVCKAKFCTSCWSNKTGTINWHNLSHCKLDVRQSTS